MTPLISGMSESDITQWLRGGWFFWLQGEGEPTLVQLAYVDGPSCKVTDINGKSYGVRAIDLAVHWPPLGCINFPSVGAAGFVQRRQNRQWNRSVRESLLHSTFPTHRPVHLTDRENVSNLFYPEYYSLPQALAMLTAGKKVEGKEWSSVAVTPRVMLAEARGDNIAVYYRTSIVGTIDPITRRISLINRKFGRRIMRSLPEALI